ncbi:NAD(P)-binding domain protein [Dichotomopilus funicola]|uniref:NAD(P)-binding domain protein n=1 Tax=Dichotomopilus funicola TaxID=1934379 RepID=A0AAN6ZPX6_9PEZI|nr:NAD(P)-binding domain protein [Dichotomopilus funicola]
MSTAIVVGATGILGREIVKQLSKTPEKWKTIYALSRSKKDEYPANVVHKHVDLLSSAEQMGKDLEGIDAEYIFFTAYLQKDTEQANWDVNGDMLDNFLKAVPHTKTKRILLVTGAKQYGVHLGQPKNPLLESDPWLTGTDFPPNFYYRQQEILHNFCAQSGPGNPSKITWTVTYPNDVIGFATGNFMNLATGIGLYVAVTKELNPNPPDTTKPTPLPFPGSQIFYTRFDTFTSARLHATFSEWAITAPGATNQAFNVVNGDAQTWSDLWPRVAHRYGMHVPPDQFTSPASSLAQSKQLHTPPPISVAVEEAGLVGTTVGQEPSVLSQRVNLVKWSQQTEVKDAWGRLAEREGLQREAFEQATWGFVDFVLGREYDIVQSMSKAREAGWMGYEDTWKSFEDVFDELEAAKVIPARKP